jgi:uncharacterized protein (TIGR02757 family)
LNSISDLKNLLDEKTEHFNKPEFIEDDPISIPHSFSNKGDIEISGFLTATISWGNRKSILNNAKRMMMLLDNSPQDFILNHSDSDLKSIKHFQHRTFNTEDFLMFIHCLSKVYENHGGLEGALTTSKSMENSLTAFPDLFFGKTGSHRSRKHVANISRNSAAKRMNMFLRWMVRKDRKGVDFGIWECVRPSELFIPLDIHSGNSARRLGLLERKQNDWRSVQLLTEELRKLDPADPVKYDYALFGMGAIERVI